MQIVIVGSGEIGKSMHAVLRDYHDVQLVDKVETSEQPLCDVLLIAFPYSEEFVAEVQRYQGMFAPKHTVVVSTVPPGTCRALNATHSPCVGIHPNLKKGIKTFKRFLAGPEASMVEPIFRRAGLKTYLFDKQETTELMKILDTTFYGVCIEFTKEIKRQCDKLGVPFEAWTVYNADYVRGYGELGHPEYARPQLVPVMSKIGGHCVLPNAHLIDSEFTKLLLALNEEYG